ncbi:hypothetical protein [Staphylococcus epidermidis]
MAEVKLSQESYDELLKDIKALRLQADTYFEQWQDAKKKAEAFDEILEITEEDCWAEDFAVYISQVIDKYKEVDHEG